MQFASGLRRIVAGVLLMGGQPSGGMGDSGGPGIDMGALMAWITTRPPDERAALLGVQALKKGQLGEAESQFRKGIQLNHGNPMAWSGLGEVRLRRGDLAGAGSATPSGQLRATAETSLQAARPGRAAGGAHEDAASSFDSPGLTRSALDAGIACHSLKVYERP